MNPPDCLVPKPRPFLRKMLSRSLAWGRLALSQVAKHLLVLAVLMGGQAFAHNWRYADAAFKVKPGVKGQKKVKWYTTMHQLGHELRHCFMGNFH